VFGFASPARGHNMDEAEEFDPVVELSDFFQRSGIDGVRATSLSNYILDIEKRELSERLESKARKDELQRKLYTKRLPSSQSIITVTVPLQLQLQLGQKSCIGSTLWSTCKNMLKHVKACKNMLKHVKACKTMLMVSTTQACIVYVFVNVHHFVLKTNSN
jgi:hypothetical protein